MGGAQCDAAAVDVAQKKGISVTFLNLFRQELALTWKQFLMLAALSGLANAAVLATINSAAAAPNREAQGLTLVTLGIIILVYIISQKGLMVQAASLAESTVSNIRARFIERLQAADLKDVEKLDRGAVYAAMSGEMQVLSDGTMNLIIVAQSVVLLSAVTLYVAFLSLPALVVAIVFIAIAAAVHLTRAGRNPRAARNDIPARGADDAGVYRLP